ncbi:hypothetical protein [Pseudobythopirellula maris]|uniref:hypothetical protein n=1 Tax=Pseudobythopirellula maris TaxID=2527991 RepID=UPI0011B7A457|nr:hypothetical protein [Pseudobythopirellula maris]
MRIALAAGERGGTDATGVQSGSASVYFQTRSGRKQKRYVKLSLCVTRGTMLPGALAVSWGPLGDKAVAGALLERASVALQPATLLADAGYNAEWVHKFCRDDWGVESWRAPSGWRSKQQAPVEDDAKAAEEERLRQALVRRVVHERAETDHRIDAPGPS